MTEYAEVMLVKYSCGCELISRYVRQQCECPESGTITSCELRANYNQLTGDTDMKWLQLVANLAPFILSAIPGIPPVLIPLVIHGIQTAEAIPGADGATKKAAAIDLVNTGITGINAVHDTHLDPAAVSAAVSTGIDTTVQVINLVHDTHVPATV